MEMVEIITITENGCIAETMDGFTVNIGDCNAEPGKYANVLVDQKNKRACCLDESNKLIFLKFSFFLKSF